jgi:hypothetical protein
MKLKTQQVGQAGEHLVAAEIHLRGGYAAMFTGNMPGIDLLASDVGRTRSIAIQVKTRRTSSPWQSDTRRGHPRTPLDDDETYWVFVDLATTRPDFYVAPSWWVENFIFETHEAYLAAHGGQRPRNPDSTHFGGFTTAVLAEWKDRWDVLGIFPPTAEPKEAPVAAVTES